MGLFSRIMLAIYGFCLIIISLIVMLVAIKPAMFDFISEYLAYDVLQSHTTRIVLFIIAFVFLVLSLAFLLSGLRVSKDKKAVSKHTSIGEIKISLNTIENIALSTSRKVNGVRDTKAVVDKMADNVSITIKAIVLPDINIPSLSEEIQQKVKSSVEDSSGIGVSSVKVMVENIYPAYKSKVE